MRKSILISVLASTVLASALTGCASDIMQGFVGQGLETAMAQYGPPDAQFDLPDGRRAFQWVDINTSTSPGQIAEEVSHGPNGRRTQTELTPAATTYNRCFYTMYARYDPARRGWVFDSFEPPAFGC